MPASAVLVETTILVDFLRQSDAVADYLDAARIRNMLICSAVTKAELFVGARTRAELRAIDQLLARFGGGIEPICIKTDETEARLARPESIGQPSAAFVRQIKIGHGAGDIEVRIGIKPSGEAGALIAQIAFHLKIGIEAEALGLTILKAAAEFFAERRFGKIGDVRRHPRDRKSGIGGLARAIVCAFLPVRIGHHRLPPNLLKSNVLRRHLTRRGNRQHAPNPVWPVRGEAERLHPAH